MVTCSDRGNAAQLRLNPDHVNYRLSASTCNRELRVNGPVIAESLWLRRTAGSGTGEASGDPAEVFNLRPDAYLWAKGQAQGRGIWQNTSAKELPPRY